MLCSCFLPFSLSPWVYVSMAREKAQRVLTWSLSFAIFVGERERRKLFALENKGKKFFDRRPSCSWSDFLSLSLPLPLASL